LERLKRLRESMKLIKKIVKLKSPGKGKLEEEEAKEAAQNRRVFAESSAKMRDTLGTSMHIFEGIAQSITKNNSLDDKLSTAQQNIISNVDHKLDEKFGLFLSDIKDMLVKKP